MIRPALTIFAFLAAPAFAGERLPLSLPLDCVYGETCLIQHYVDAIPGPGHADHECGPLSYDGHEGVDFRILDREALKKGVAVLAAADGVVREVFNQSEDHNFSGFENQLDCGNGLTLDHGDGWVTQYCHLRRGSIWLKSGDRVRQGGTIGALGSSGATEFPHLHFAVRRHGAIIDPFTSVTPMKCNPASPGPMWLEKTGASYVGTARMGFGVTGVFPNLQTVERDPESLIPPEGPSAPVYVWYQLLGAKKGDSLRLTVFGTDGKAFASEVLPIDEDAAVFVANIGVTPKDLERETWPEGVYRAHAELYAGSIPLSADALEFDLPM